MPQRLGISCKAYAKVGELVQPGKASENCFEVCLLGLEVGGNYAWCLVVVVIFMGFEGVKSWGKL